MLTQPPDVPDSANESWVLHEPDPALFFPAHLRRELLLENGERTIVASRDPTQTFENDTFYYIRNDSVFATYAVKELHGLEERFELQDPALRVTPDKLDVGHQQA